MKFIGIILYLINFYYFCSEFVQKYFLFKKNEQPYKMNVKCKKRK